MKSPLKSLSLLGALHALFFIFTAVFIFFVRERGDIILATGFLIIGVFSAFVWRFSEKKPAAAYFFSIAALFSYWGLAFYFGRYSGFINGISITVTIMGILGGVLLIKNPEKNHL